MGCSKNLVDSERLLRRLEAKGYRAEHNPETPTGEYVVVNTCGFIADAKQESIDMILELGEAKERGEIGNICVMGCLSQRYLELLPQEMPEVDRWYGKFDWQDFIDTLPDRSCTESRGSDNERSGKQEGETPKSWDRTLTTPPWSAFLKISEGCDRFCAFCAIPLITGRHTSRPMEEIEEEVKELVGRGVKEFNVIAQDLSDYGLDLYKRHALPELIEHIADIPGVEWIRLHYAYPARFPKDLLRVMRERDNVCKYLDIALQHISDRVLTNMRRHITAAETEALLDEMRREVPGLKLRTTLMVGFPGEEDEDFRLLLDFVKRQKFDRMGAFSYCEEEDTWAAQHLSDDIPEEVKQLRLDKLMALQQDIALELNEKMVGETIKVLIERHEGADAIGRTQWDSPEVDPEVIVKDCDAEPGSFVSVKITEALPFELIGRLA